MDLYTKLGLLVIAWICLMAAIMLANYRINSSEAAFEAEIDADLAAKGVARDLERSLPSIDEADAALERRA